MRRIIIIILLAYINIYAFCQSNQIDHWETIISSDTIFRYWTSNQGAPDANWRDVNFDDSNWNTGRGGIGYSDNDDLTVIENCTSVMMRTGFATKDTTILYSAILNMDYDDGFVAYLNGIEIGRSPGLEGDYPSYDQFSTVEHEAPLHEGGIPENYEISDSMLKSILSVDTNILAIQVHNRNAVSSDLSSNTFFSVGIKTSDSYFQSTPDWFHVPTEVVVSDSIPHWLRLFEPTIYKDSNYIATADIFDVNSIATIKITMASSDYSSLINNTSSNTYRIATMTYESSLIPLDTVKEVGIRLRGKAARKDTRKKSFKISFREFGYDNREFHGIRKLNLNCDFQDPHLMRAKICTELFRQMGVPAARVGYAKLYINGEYRGLFANYEELDKVLLESRFPENDGNLYKGTNNATMQYRSAQDYDKVAGWGDELAYDLKTNEELHDFSDLSHFINVLNNTSRDQLPEKIEKVFDVDRFLMYLACNVMLGAWDDYWVLAKNYYFYHDLYNGRFTYIPHDFDGSLGTDWYLGSVAYKNIYTWTKDPNNRPMVEKLLAIDKYKKKYSYYIYLLCSYPFSLKALEPEIDRTVGLIRNTLVNDPYWSDKYGWTASDFDNSLVRSISKGEVDYGLKEYISLRQESALTQLTNYPPFIDFVKQTPVMPVQSDSITITAFGVGMNNISSIQLIIDSNGIETTINMLDNGNDADTLAGDYIYTAKIPPAGSNGNIKYYINATDGLGKIARYPESGWISANTNYTPPEIYINEIMADNKTAVADEYGEYDDWFELYNPNNYEIDLSGMYISDNMDNPRKWQLRNLVIPAADILVLWADNDTHQGNRHVAFKLNRNGEKIGLFDTDIHANIPIDVVEYGSMMADISYARTPDGSDDWTYIDLRPVEPLSINQPASFAQDNIIIYQNYPNPFSSNTTLSFDVIKENQVSITIYNVTGQKIIDLTNRPYSPGSYQINWDGTNMNGYPIENGLYFCEIIAGYEKKVIQMLYLK